MNHSNNKTDHYQASLSWDQQEIANREIVSLEAVDWQGRLLTYVGQRFENARWAIMVERLVNEKDKNGEGLDDNKLAVLLGTSPQSIGRWKKGIPASEAKRDEVRKLYDSKFDDAPILMIHFDEILKEDRLIVSPQFAFAVEFKGLRMATGMVKHVMECHKEPRSDGGYANSYKEIGSQQICKLIKEINAGWTPEMMDDAFETSSFARMGSPEFIRQGAADISVLNKWGLACLVAKHWVLKNKVQL